MRFTYYFQKDSLIYKILDNLLHASLQLLHLTAILRIFRQFMVNHETFRFNANVFRYPESVEMRKKKKNT